MSRMNEGSAQKTQGDLRETAAQVKENLRDIGGQVRDTAQQQYEQLRQQANDYYERGRERALEMEQSLEQYVQEKPIQALLMAAGAGLLLGLLWKFLQAKQSLPNWALLIFIAVGIGALSGAWFRRGRR